MSLLKWCDEGPATVSLQATVEDAINTMLEKQVGAVAVIDEHGVVAGMRTQAHTSTRAHEPYGRNGNRRNHSQRGASGHAGTALPPYADRGRPREDPGHPLHPQHPGGAGGRPADRTGCQPSGAGQGVAYRCSARAPFDAAIINLIHGTEAFGPLDYCSLCSPGRESRDGWGRSG